MRAERREVGRVPDAPERERDSTASKGARETFLEQDLGAEVDRDDSLRRKVAATGVSRLSQIFPSLAQSLYTYFDLVLLLMGLLHAEVDHSGVGRAVAAKVRARAGWSGLTRADGLT